MDYILALVIISHVYAFAYMVQDERLRIYRFSVILLLTLVGLCVGFALFGMVSHLTFIGRISSEFFHAALLQSLLCTIVSARIAVKNEYWSYLSHTVMFLTLFLITMMLKTLAA